MTTSRLDHAIFWQVFPLGACGAPMRDFDPATVETSHRLPRLLPWLDHAVELGCNGLLLGPIFASTSHGYDTLDHFRIDPRLGDDADFAALVDAAHARGLMVVLDGVFNHVGAHHPLVAAAATGNGLVRLGDDGHQGWEGHGDLAELDHDDPRTADLVVEVMSLWLARGIDGWRLDVAYAVPSAFWREVCGRVRAQHPDAFFIGEVLHGDFAQIADDGTLDAVTAYELWKATWSSIKDANMFELAWALQRHDEFASRARLQTFVGNHDVERIATLVGDAGAALAAVVLFTVPGIPSVYYGDEDGFRGRKLTGFSTDDEIRPVLPDSPADLSEHGAWLRRLHQELVGLRRRNPWLGQARVAVVANTNPTIHYEATADGHRAEVFLDVAAPSARVVVDGQEAFAWRG